MSLMDIKSDFPIFSHYENLAYFDSSSTTLVPSVVLDAVSGFLQNTVASARRGAHRLATRGSSQVEQVRTRVADFLATETSSISFHNSIPSLVSSLVYGFDWKRLGKKKLVIAQSEEHSVSIALLRAAQVLGLKVELLPTDRHGNLQIERLEECIDSNTGITAVGHVIVGTGIENPVPEVAKIAHDCESLVLTDVSRNIYLDNNSVNDLGADIIIMSANTNFMAPPGLAIQWIEPSLGREFTPGILGGSSVANVTFPVYEVSLQPDKFESGILNVPSIVGLGAAIDYLEQIGPHKVKNHVKELSTHLISNLSRFAGLTVFGVPHENQTIIGFTLGSEDTISCHDIALFLDQSDIAVRSGFLCAHSLVSTLSPDGIIQLSLQGYNTCSDCSRFLSVLRTISEDFL